MKNVRQCPSASARTPGAVKSFRMPQPRASRSHPLGIMPHICAYTDRAIIGGRTVHQYKPSNLRSSFACVMLTLLRRQQRWNSTELKSRFHNPPSGSPIQSPPFAMRRDCCPVSPASGIMSSAATDSRLQLLSVPPKRESVACFQPPLAPANLVSRSKTEHLDGDLRQAKPRRSVFFKDVRHAQVLSSAGFHGQAAFGAYLCVQS